MDRFRCMLLYLAAGRGPEREMTFVVEGEEPFYWTALKPVTCYGYPADPRYGLEAPPLVRFRVDGEGGWLEACDFELDRRPLDRVRLFSSGDGGRRFHSFRFVWAADGRRVRFEIDGRVEAVAELAAKRLSVRGGDGGRAFHALWSKQGHGWDESLLEAFDRVPEALPGKPFWRPVPKLPPAMRLYCTGSLYFGLVTFWLAAGLAGARYLRFEQALFGWIALRCANRILQCFANPYRLLAERVDPEFRPPEGEEQLKYRNRTVTRCLVYILLAVFGLCDFVPGWIPWAVMVAIHYAPFAPMMLAALGILTPGMRKLEKLARTTPYQWEVREKLTRSHLPKVPFFASVLRRHFAGKKVVIGVSERFGGEREYDEAAEVVTAPLAELAEEAGVTVEFVPDGLTAAKLDASFAGHDDAACFFSFGAGWRAWTGTELWKRPPGSRPAVFVCEAGAMEFKEVFAAIRDGRLAGAGIEALKLPHLDLASLLPEELKRVGDDGENRRGEEIAPLLPVDSGNVDAVIALLVQSSLGTFRPLLRPEVPAADNARTIR